MTQELHHGCFLGNFPKSTSLEHPITAGQGYKKTFQGSFNKEAETVWYDSQIPLKIIQHLKMNLTIDLASRIIFAINLGYKGVPVPGNFFNITLRFLITHEKVNSFNYIYIATFSFRYILHANFLLSQFHRESNQLSQSIQRQMCNLLNSVNQLKVTSQNS